MSEKQTQVPASKPNQPFNNLTPQQQKAVWIILPIALFAVWLLNSNSGTTSAGAAPGGAVVVSPAPTTAVNASASAHEALVSRCVDAALDEGYGKAQCAEAFIDICVEKQSKTEMARMAALSRSYGPMHMNGGMCGDNQVAKYGKEFDQKLAARDKF